MLFRSYYDEETGMHYNWNRYYDPESGRYSQTDPIGFESGEMNLYLYVRNNSVHMLDENGKAGKKPNTPPKEISIPDKFVKPDNIPNRDRADYCEKTYYSIWINAIRLLIFHDAHI